MFSTVLKFIAGGAFIGFASSVIVNKYKKENVDWKRSGKWAGYGAVCGGVCGFANKAYSAKYTSFSENITPTNLQKTVSKLPSQNTQKLAIESPVAFDPTIYTGCSSPLFDKDAWQYIR